MFRILAKPTPISVQISPNRFRPLQGTLKRPQCSVTSSLDHDRDEELRNARSISEMPGPKSIPLIGVMHHFFPGGRFHNVKMIDLQFKLREEYGDIILLPGMFGRPNLVTIYDPDLFAKLFRNEGKYPHRRSFAVFEYFRKHERPDLFKGKAGLLSE